MSESIEIDFSDEEVLRYALLAHDENITLNQWLVNAVISRVATQQDELIKILEDEIASLRAEVEDLETMLANAQDPHLRPLVQDIQGFAI